MRVFRIYAEGIEGSANFKKFAKEVEERINDDEEIIKSAKEVNQKFFALVKNACENDENELFLGSMILGEVQKMPRYCYKKHCEYEGAEYEAEIDLLKRTFTLMEVQ